MKALVTGIAGFIGFHVAKRLLSEGYSVVGIDNLNDYYDVQLKKDRLKELGIYESDNTWVSSNAHLSFIKIDLQEKDALLNLFSDNKFDYVVHLAAQAGVRYSLSEPQRYLDSNITGFLNILECCRFHPVRHLVFASSSNLYLCDNNATLAPQELNSLLKINLLDTFCVVELVLFKKFPSKYVVSDFKSN